MNTAADAGKPSEDDGVNNDLWARLRTVVSSASRGDADSHSLELMRWPTEVSLAGQQHAGVYLLYLLYRTVKTALGKSPTPADLHELTITVYPRFRKVIRADDVQLEDTFRRAFELPPSGHP